MIREPREVELLSREELDAILSDTSARRLEEERSRKLAPPFRRDRRVRRAGPAPSEPELRTAVETAASSWGQALAGRYQQRIECSLIDWQAIDTQSFAQALLPNDRVATFTLGATAARGLVLITRPLFFALMTRAFGGHHSGSRPLPNRDYTQIERRFLLSAARDVVAALERGWSRWYPQQAHVEGLRTGEEVVALCQDSLVFGALDVSGLLPVGRLRVGLPAKAFQRVPEVARKRPASGDSPLGADVADLPVSLRAEIGTAEISLRDFGSLRVGDVVMIEPSAADGYLVRVEGRPKFVATRGSVGGRLAVQLRERIVSGEAR